MFRSRAYVGIDVGHHSVKVAALGANQKQIVDLWEAEVAPERQLLEENIPEQQLINQVKSAVAKVVDPLRSRYTLTFAASLQAEDLGAKYVELPPLDKKAQEIALQSAALKFVPISPSELFFSFSPVRAVDGGKKDAFFLIVLRRAQIEAAQDFLRKIELPAEKLEVPLIPMLRAFSTNHGKSDAFQALVHVGSRYTTITVVRGDEPYYWRSFKVASGDFTYAFQMGAQSTWKEAEAYKRACDVTQREVAIEPILKRWTDQVRKSLEAFASEHREQGVRAGSVVLTGGGAAWKGLPERLSEAVGVPVTVDGWDRLRPEGRLETVPTGPFNVALGLHLPGGLVQRQPERQVSR